VTEVLKGDFIGKLFEQNSSGNGQSGDVIFNPHLSSDDEISAAGTPRDHIIFIMWPCHNLNPLSFFLPLSPFAPPLIENTFSII
jgi:hypothetical protein